MRQHFVFFAAVAYDSVLGGRTFHLAQTLAAHGHQVTFVDMPGPRATARRVLSPWRRRAAAGVRVVQLWPMPTRLLLRDTALAGAWVRHVRRHLRRHIPGLTSAVVVVSTPWWVPVLRELPYGLLCYDYIDHVRVHAPAPYLEGFLGWDQALLAMSHLVVTVSETLRQDIVSRVGTKPVWLIPNAVKQAWMDTPLPPRPRYLMTPHPAKPLVGFLGALFEWIDIPLLVHTALALPDMEFVLVGPTRRGMPLEPFQRLPNLRRFGPQAHDEVPGWIKAFDVCLIPFRHDLVAAAADPIKVYEYCAFGKPVVSSVRFHVTQPAAPIAVACQPAQFAAAIAHAMATDTPALRAARLAFARSHTWERRARDVVDAVQSVTATRASG